MRWLLACALLCCLAGCQKGSADPLTHFEFHNPDELAAFFDTHHYNIETWQDGDRSVPRFYLQQIPARWGKEVAPGLPVLEKKRVFFFALAPLVLAANETVMHERERLLALLAKPGSQWTADDREWLEKLAHDYNTDGAIDDVRTQARLKRRVDIVPTSLVLAQAATESGWGTSRFAAEGNALFGQWTWKGGGITPAEQRTASKGNYQIKAFDTPKDSVRSYLHNINTGHAYQALRSYRKKLRDQKKPLTGYGLADGLLKYSERGQKYVDEVRAIIRINRLQPTDEAFLRDMPPVLITPVGEGA